MKIKIAFFVLCSSMLGLGSAQASYVSVNDATRNDSMSRAFNLDSHFDSAFDANIGSPVDNISTSFLHASVNATTGNRNSGLDWYSFTTTQSNVQAYFDIDRGMPDLDSWIKLYDSNHHLISQNDDGNVRDPGSSNGWDSFLSQVLTNPGMYYLSVGQYLWNGHGGMQFPLSRGQDYTLHVSFASIRMEPAPAAVPVPAAIWLFGSSIVGLMCFSRRKMVEFFYFA
jgi:hypothetical protein